MPDENEQAEKIAAANGAGAEPAPLRQRLYGWAQRAWRPAGTAVAVGLAGLLMWQWAEGRRLLRRGG